MKSKIFIIKHLQALLDVQRQNHDVSLVGHQVLVHSKDSTIQRLQDRLDKANKNLVTADTKCCDIGSLKARLEKATKDNGIEDRDSKDAIIHQLQTQLDETSKDLACLERAKGENERKSRAQDERIHGLEECQVRMKKIKSAWEKSSPHRRNEIREKRVKSALEKSSPIEVNIV